MRQTNLPDLLIHQLINDVSAVVSVRRGNSAICKCQK